MPTSITKKRSGPTPGIEVYLQQKIGINPMDELAYDSTELHRILNLIFADSSDFITRTFEFEGRIIRCYYFQGIVDEQRLQTELIYLLIEASAEDHATEAVEHLIETLTVLFFGHVKVVMIHEDVAREDMKPVLDFVERTAIIGNNILLLIIKEEEGKEFLSRESPLTKLPALYMSQYFMSDQKVGRSGPIRVYEYMRDANMISHAASIPIAVSDGPKLLIEQHMEQAIEHDIRELIDNMKASEVEPWYFGHQLWANAPKYFDTLNWDEEGWQEAEFDIEVDFILDIIGKRGRFGKVKVGR